MPRIFLTEELIMTNLTTLSHGGKEATSLFLKMSKRLHEEGAKDALQDWITIAAPALPEKERNEVLVMLMCSHLFLDCQKQSQMGLRAPSPSLH